MFLSSKLYRWGSRFFTIWLLPRLQTQALASPISFGVQQAYQGTWGGSWLGEPAGSEKEMYCSRELHNHHSYLPPPTEYRHCKVTIETRSKKSSDPHHDSARAPTTHISCLPPQQALTLNQQTGILLWGSHLVTLKAYTSHACFLVFAHTDLPPWNNLLLPFTLLNSAHL